MKKHKIKPDKRGVTMMETIVALGILILGVVSALALMASSLAFSQTSEQSIVVANLAREGIEMVRSIRELETQGFDSLTEGDKIVTIDVDNNDALLLTHLGSAGSISISSCNDCKLKLYNGRYIHHSTLGDDTIFRRLITITDEVLNQEKKIISQVYWTERGRDHTFKLEVHLTDW